MDKQKEIEEMANCYNCIHEDICQLRTYSYCEEKVKEKGCKQYQPKIDKDKVVLTREEYAKLQEKIVDLKCDRLDLKNEISEKDNKIKLLEETIECIKFNVDFTRKETAEKILNKILKIKMPFLSDLDHIAYMRQLKDLAKQFGIEIKE